MFRLEHDILIEKSPEVVWAFLANLPVSLTCHRLRYRFQWIGAPKPGLGGRYSLELNLPGIILQREGRITRWEPPHSLAMAQWSPRHPHRGFVRQQWLSVHPVDGCPLAAVLRSTIVGSWGPWYVEAPFKEIIRRSMLDHLEVLKCAIESTDRSGRARQDPARHLAEMPVVGAG
ncbi:MAG: hypothetical protein GH143_01560 [Calditrichaeota bacterium]|nr:hypothetical protein [Calditrichota bacterium]